MTKDKDTKDKDSPASCSNESSKVNQGQANSGNNKDDEAPRKKQVSFKVQTKPTTSHPRSYKLTLDDITGIDSAQRRRLEQQRGGAPPKSTSVGVKTNALVFLVIMFFLFLFAMTTVSDVGQQPERLAMEQKRQEALMEVKLLKRERERKEYDCQVYMSECTLPGMTHESAGRFSLFAARGYKAEEIVIGPGLQLPLPTPSSNQSMLPNPVQTMGLASFSTMAFPHVSTLIKPHPFLHNVKGAFVPCHSLASKNFDHSKQKEENQSMENSLQHQCYVILATRTIRPGEEFFFDSSSVGTSSSPSSYSSLNASSEDNRMAPSWQNYQQADAIVLDVFKSVKKPQARGRSPREKTVEASTLKLLKQAVRRFDPWTAALIPGSFETVKKAAELILSNDAPQEEQQSTKEKAKTKEKNWDASRSTTTTTAAELDPADANLDGRGTALTMTKNRTAFWLDDYARGCFDTLTGATTPISGVSSMPQVWLSPNGGAYATQPIRKGARIVPVPVVVFPQAFGDPHEQHHEWINSCWGHEESSVLMCPTTLAVLIRPSKVALPATSMTSQCDETMGDEGAGKSTRQCKAQTRTTFLEANAVYQWSEWNSVNTKYHKMSVEELPKEGAYGLSWDCVALRDIAPGEEIVMDYGGQWRQAWETTVTACKDVLQPEQGNKEKEGEAFSLTSEEKERACMEESFRHYIPIHGERFPPVWKNSGSEN